MASLVRVVLLLLPLSSGLKNGDTLAKFLAKSELEPELEQDHESQQPPRTAILLSGLMRNWDRWDGEWIKCFMERMVIPNDADIFIHTTGWEGKTRKLTPDVKVNLPANSSEIFGRKLAAWKIEDEPELEPGMSDMQYWHLAKAWEMMSAYEQDNNFRYDVVVKTRTELAPARSDSSAILDLSKWKQDKGKIHMMTDMIWWGERDDVQKTIGFYTAIPMYYQQQFPDPLSRPIHVKELLASFEADPLYSTGDLTKEMIRTIYTVNGTYNKIAMLPYPDMGESGPIANLRAAVKAGIDVCINGRDGCVSHYGEQGSGGDYKFGQVRVEKDIIDYILQQGLSICDIGASMHTIFYKGYIEKRALARDC